MFVGTSISEAFWKDFGRVLGSRKPWFSHFFRFFFEVNFKALFGRPKNRKKIEKIEKRAILEPKIMRPAERTRPLAEPEPSGYSWSTEQFHTPSHPSGCGGYSPGAFGRTSGRAWQRASGQTIAGGARVVRGAEQKRHLIEAASFGCLDQMLRTSV